jgi:glycosyltransferase involved in cell wall biosynthesis
MPCLNEFKTLPACIKKAQEAIKNLGLPGEIIIADNGSTDGSQELAESLGARVVDVPVRGYGAALIWGIRAAKGQYIVMGDSDDSYDFREAQTMIEKLELGYDLCMGTRLKGRIMPGAMPWKHRYLGTPVLTFIVNWLFRAGFSDVNCGMRAFTKSAFLQMEMESTGMEFASEMLVKSSILRLKTTEIPITLYKDGRDRRPHLKTWSDGWRHLKYIVLFAPKFIYWIPGIICFLVGGILAIALNLTPERQAVNIAGLLFNDHWIVVAALLFLIGYEILFTGLLAYLYTLTHRVNQRSVKMEKLIRWMSLERILLLTAILLGSGLALEFSVIKSWISGDFANLNAFRPAITGMALILMSSQTLFSGLFYVVLAEKYANKLLNPPIQEN